LKGTQITKRDGTPIKLTKKEMEDYVNIIKVDHKVFKMEQQIMINLRKVAKQRTALRKKGVMI